MKNLLEQFETRQLKKNIAPLKTGDTVRVHVKIKEGDKERIQIFEGIVTRLAKGKVRSTMTVRKISFGVGVERVFPLHSPALEKIERLAEGRVRRSRLYYLRQRRGKRARIESELTEQLPEEESATEASSAPAPSSIPESGEKKAKVGAEETATLK